MVLCFISKDNEISGWPSTHQLAWQGEGGEPSYSTGSGKWIYIERKWIIPCYHHYFFFQFSSSELSACKENLFPRCLEWDPDVLFLSIDHLFSSPPALIPKGPAVAVSELGVRQSSSVSVSFDRWVTKALGCRWVSLFKVGLGKYWPSKFLPGNWCISIFQNSCRTDKTNW